MPITPFAAIQAVPLAGDNVSNDPGLIDLNPLRADVLSVPPGHGYDYLRVSVNYFTGGGE
jgi:hypothetical protein